MSQTLNNLCACGSIIQPNTIHNCQYNTISSYTPNCIRCCSSIIGTNYTANNSGPYCYNCYCCLTTGYTCNNCYTYVPYNSYHNCPNTTTVSAYNLNPTVIESLLNIERLYGIKGKCSSCKLDKDLVLSYSMIKIERRLCCECVLTRADKLMGIESNVKLESTLYK